jgi:hypothetical protein
MMKRPIFALLATATLGFGSVPLLTFPVSLTSSVIHAAVTDAAGNVYVTGTTFWNYPLEGGTNNFPVTPGAFQTLYGSRNCMAQPIQNFYCQDAFVAKYSSAGQLIYATYLGGSGEDVGMAIAVDASGNAWVAGYTASANFPVTPNALQKKNAGGTLFFPPPCSLRFRATPLSAA